MVILMLTDALTAGGKERRLVELIKGLSRMDDVSCHVALIDNEIHYKEVYEYSKGVFFLNKRFKKDPKVFYNLYQLCTKIKPDIIHTWGLMPPVYAFPVAKLMGIKLVNSLITNAPDNLPLLHERKVSAMLSFPFSNIILSNSFAGIKSYKAPVNKSRVIYNGFDFNRIERLGSSQSIREKFHIKTDKVVCMVGAFEPRKDYYTFVKGAKQILNKRNDVTFLCVGGGKNLHQIQKLVDASESDRIIFTGKQKDIESVVNISTVCVLLTNQKIHGEGISNAILEYMALSKPVVATKGGGTVEIVKNDITGFLIAAESEDEFVEKTNYLLDNPATSNRMGMKGRSAVMKNFNANRKTEEYFLLYSELLQTTHTPSSTFATL